MSEEIKSHHLRALACDIEDCHNPQSWADYCRAAAAMLEIKDARIAELEAENAGLSANQCLHSIHGDEAGNPYCPRIAELEAALAALQRDASQQVATDEMVRRLQHLGDWQAADRIEALQKRVAELEGVLDFYACIDHYQTHNAAAPIKRVLADGGAKARAALTGGKE